MMFVIMELKNSTNLLSSPAALIQYSVASINLFNFIAPPNAYYDFENIYSTEQWRKKCAWISDFIQQNQPDIIGFQEVFSPDALKALCHQLGYDYFAVLDEPEVQSDYVYRHPVVALASRYPITEMANVEADQAACQALGLSQFNFSRLPLRATVELPQFGPCDCYVIHLKSKRSGFDKDDLADSGASGAADFISRQVLGRWASSIQRGNEATFLCHQMLIRKHQKHTPFVLMGDFNDKLHSDLLAAFHQSLRVYRNDIDDKKLAGLSEQQLLAELNQFRIYDSYELFKATTKSNASLALDEFESVKDTDIQLPISRPATHYYGSEGSVLDYILVSSEFDPKQLKNLAHIEQYQTFDRHLVRPDYERDSDSTDHAPVMMTFSLR
ncbi:endonuclease/exonuclease/phosphatase family protein [Shewanella glacialimarina]|jgi:endonuclease/exonuclease/phosphatase family metal-dependent hydrolase|uniref:endonuclease/exonuclease/phosphatase family protein n=1 Tax=Shewanella glacialimarina TaxID=2590884 RepID=UPI001CF9219E|nr:endonuclease/exonuclease/phosphatase family protein [Shewanella glacialimarina]